MLKYVFVILCLWVICMYCGDGNYELLVVNIEEFCINIDKIVFILYNILVFIVGIKFFIVC